MSGENMESMSTVQQVLFHDAAFESRELEFWWNDALHFQMQIRKWGTLAFTLLITARFLKKKKKNKKTHIDLYVKDSEVKVIVSKAGTTRVWLKWKAKIKDKQRSKIPKLIVSQNQVFY